MKVKLLFLSLLSVFLGWAQEGPELSSAILALDKGDVVSGKPFMDNAKSIIESKAPGEVKPKNMQKYLYYMGFMNLLIATSQEAAILELNANACEDAERYYGELLAHEKSLGKEKFTPNVRNDYGNLAVGYANRGFARNEKGDDAGASQDFRKVYELRKSGEPSQVDSTSLFNAALLAEKAGDPASIDRAIVWNQELIDMGFDGITYTVTDPKGGKFQMASRALAEEGIKQGLYTQLEVGESIRDEVYKAQVRLYKAKKDDANYKKALAEARAAYPNDETLLRVELQDFLDSGNYTAAMANLDQAIAQDPTNPLFYYVKGYIFQTNMKKEPEALAAYDKAIELKPDYVEALYMKGSLYVNRANEMTEVMNKLPLNATKQYNKLKADQTKEFEMALPLFEQAHKAEPKDVDTIKALKEVYYKLGKLDKSKEMDALLLGAQ
ncbi:tetratricopeptide repeat protein [bacterium]|nr:tetratricopeptide repeat protein [bacterium]